MVLLGLAWLTTGGQGVATITFFTLPACGACKRLQPELDRLKGMGPPDLDVVQVDCSTDDCSAVQKYPTIVCGGREYQGERTAEAMKAWALGVA